MPYLELELRAIGIASKVTQETELEDIALSVSPTNSTPAWEAGVLLHETRFFSHPFSFYP